MAVCEISRPPTPEEATMGFKTCTLMAFTAAVIPATLAAPSRAS
jgi:hypothetical protein